MDLTPIGNDTNTLPMPWGLGLGYSIVRYHIINLKEHLHIQSKGSKSISKYLQHVKCHSNKLALMNTPLTNDDLILYFPNGLNPKFKEIMVVVRACENPISFEELCYKLVEHETMISHGMSKVDPCTCFSQLHPECSQTTTYLSPQHIKNFRPS